MNIIKQMFETPDTPSGKKRLNNLITRLGLGKKVKGDLMKDVVSGELGGASGGEDDYVYMKLVSPYEDKHDEEIYGDFGSYFGVSTIIGIPINNLLQNPIFMIYFTGICNSIKSVAGSVYVQESGDGDAGLGGKLSLWDLSSTINNEWNGGGYKRIRAIQFYKNANTIGQSYANSVPNPNYNGMAGNDILLRKIAEYCKNKLPEYFTEYETINVYITVALMFVGVLVGINVTDYAGVISYLDKLIEECKNEQTDLNYFLNISSKKTFVEITKEEYDNICIDIMKTETAGYNKETLYEMYIAYNNQIEEMFKQ